MDYLNALTTKLRSYLLFSTILLPCAFGSCTNSDSRAGNKDLTKSGCIEVLYRSPNDLTYKISLDDCVLTYSYGGESSFFVGYKCKIKPRTSPVTPEDISLFLNNSGFSDWKLQVSENGKEVRGSKAHEISEYLVVLYSRILQSFYPAMMRKCSTSQRTIYCINALMRNSRGIE